MGSGASTRLAPSPSRPCCPWRPCGSGYPCHSSTWATTSATGSSPTSIQSEPIKSLVRFRPRSGTCTPPCAPSWPASSPSEPVLSNSSSSSAPSTRTSSTISLGSCFSSSSSSSFLAPRSPSSWSTFNFVARIIDGGGGHLWCPVDRPYTWQPTVFSTLSPSWKLTNSSRPCCISPTQQLWSSHFGC